MEATTFCVSPSTLAVRSSAIVVRRSASADRSVGSAANSGKAATPANIKINVAVDGDLFMSVWRRSDHRTNMSNLLLEVFEITVVARKLAGYTAWLGRSGSWLPLGNNGRDFLQFFARCAQV